MYENMILMWPVLIEKPENYQAEEFLLMVELYLLGLMKEV